MVYRNTTGKRLYVNVDRSKVVPEDSGEAAFLLVGDGGELTDQEAAKYGLDKPAPKADRVEDKAVAAPAEAPAADADDPAPKAKAKAVEKVSDKAVEGPRD